jgi:hypothetical protein
MKKRFVQVFVFQARENRVPAKRQKYPALKAAALSHAATKRKRPIEKRTV